MADIIFNQNKPFNIGECLDPPILDELNTWIKLLEVLGNGVVKPYNHTFVIEQITKLEKKTGEDFTKFKNCCPSEGTIREALEYKPYIRAILDRINYISNLKVRT